jgi:hypothetical protein
LTRISKGVIIKHQQHKEQAMPFWMQTEDPDYLDDATWEDDEDQYEDEQNDAHTQSDTLPG